MTARFRKDCALLRPDLQRELNDIAEQLRRDPLDSALNAKKLTAVAGNLYRARMGDYRIVYSFTSKTLLLRGIAHRKDVYRFL